MILIYFFDLVVIALSFLNQFILPILSLKLGIATAIISSKPTTIIIIWLDALIRPRDIMAMSKTLEYVDKIVNEIPIYEMGCNISKEAAAVAYDAMKDGTL